VRQIKVIEACKTKYGDRIDVLLNIAGVMDTNNSVDTLDDAMWDRVIAINLTAPVKLCRAVIHTMLRQGSGSIVNVASKAGISGSASGVAYTSSKHGIVREAIPVAG
jgi:NAD(P)-dependent dehydrogenase (short-subunit alcohol dehydrogenase family)